MIVIISIIAAIAIPRIGAGVGWVYNETTGKIIAGTDAAEKDKDGVVYNTC